MNVDWLVGWLVVRFVGCFVQVVSWLGCWMVGLLADLAVSAITSLPECKSSTEESEMLEQIIAWMCAQAGTRACTTRYW